MTMHKQHVRSLQPGDDSAASLDMKELRDREIDLWEIFVALWDAKWLILAGTLASAVAAFAVSLVVTNRYEALATIFVTPPTFSSELRPPPLSVEAYERLAQSDYIQNRVTDELRKEKLLGDTELAGRWKTALYASREPQKPYLPLIGLIVEADQPEKAQRIVNRWAELFVLEEKKLANVGSRGSVDFILKEFPTSAAQLGEEQKRLRDVQDRHARELATLKTTMNVEFKQAELQAREAILVDLEKQLSKIRVDVQEARHAVEHLQKELARTPEFTVVAKAITDEALWQSLGGGPDSAAKLAELAKSRLRSEEVNEVYVNLAGKLADERVRHNALVPFEKGMVEQIANERRAVDALRANMLSSHLTITNLERQHKLEMNGQERAIAEFQSRFDKLKEKIGDAQLAKAEEQSNVKVGALAETPRRPSSPKILPITLMAALVGFVLSLGAAWIVGHLRNRDKVVRDVTTVGVAG